MMTQSAGKYPSRVVRFTSPVGGLVQNIDKAIHRVRTPWSSCASNTLLGFNCPGSGVV